MQDINMPAWQTPDSYMGFDPIGDYCLYAKTRDSDILTESNWDEIQKELKTILKTLPKPESRYDGYGKELPSAWLYTWSASHWACGWVEYMMIRADAPKELIEKANEIYSMLKFDYPILNEEDYSKRQEESINEYWIHADIKERIELCTRNCVNIFAARRSEEMPEDVYDDLRQWDCFA